MKFVASQIAYFLSEREMRRNAAAFLRYVVVLCAVILLYTVLFQVIMRVVEGQSHSWMSGLYWTVVTMSTLGYGDIIFETDVGRAFSTFVLVSGVVLLLILLPFIFLTYFAGPWLQAQVRLRAPRSLPDDVTGHVIICGWDTITPGLTQKLRLQNIPYVVIEPDVEVAARMHADGISAVAGEVDGRLTYEALHAWNARMLFANRSDTVNTNITLTAREVAPDLPITAIIADDDSLDILQLSGCTHVLPLRRQLGEQLATRVNAGHTRAHTIGRFHDLLIAEFPVQNTPLAGRTIRELGLRQATGVNILAVWEHGRLGPALPDTRLGDHSVPVVLGTADQIAELDTLLIIYNVNYNPVVVIGGGKVGRAASRTLRRNGIAVHLIERKPELRERIGQIPNKLFIGDAADRRILSQAGIDEAPSVLLSTHDDAMNIYLAVYCRRLNPDLRIVSRVTHEKNVEAVIRAGADFVLSYDSLGVQTVFSLLLGRELVVLGEGVDLFRVPVPPTLVGQTLAESEIGARTGLNVIAIRHDGVVLTNLRPGLQLEPDTELIMFGSPEQRDTFNKTFEKPAGRRR